MAHQLVGLDSPRTLGGWPTMATKTCISMACHSISRALQGEPKMAALMAPHSVWLHTRLVTRASGHAHASGYTRVWLHTRPLVLSVASPSSSSLLVVVRKAGLFWMFFDLPPLPPAPLLLALVRRRPKHKAVAKGRHDQWRQLWERTGMRECMMRTAACQRTVGDQSGSD